MHYRPFLPSPRHGFTLIEIAVVLVIAGLIIGGIMGGQSLLRQSQLQTVISDYTKYSSTANQFRLQYGGWPGDLADATNYWGDDATNCSDTNVANGSPGTCNGNGDGDIADSTEPYRAWQQLVLAKLIKGSFSGTGTAAVPGTNTPSSRVSGAGWNFGYKAVTSSDTDWYDQELKNFLTFGATNAATLPQGATLTASEAWNIDKKLDDSTPAYGRVVALKPSPSTIAPNCTTSATDASAAYNITNSSVTCSLNMSLTTK